MSGVPVAERLARAALSRVTEPDDEQIGAFVAELGAVETWRRLSEATLALRGDKGAAIAARLPGIDPHADLAALDRLGGRLICPGDDEWPAALDDLPIAGKPLPLALWARGPLHLAETLARSVSVVGARAATSYGVQFAAGLAAELAADGVSVVSGGAYGIDAAAHRGALATGATVVVLACGLDVRYPSRHAELFARIEAGGLVVSEWPPGSAAMRHRFLTRNRVIAALTQGTVVVEAALRSGALSTARHADELSRAVMAVPGPVGSASSAGCHWLIRERGAVLVTSVADVLELVAPMGTALTDAQRGPTQPRDSLDPLARRVLDAVPLYQPRDVGRIARAAGLAPLEVLRRLGALLAHGLVEQVDSGWRVHPAARPHRPPSVSAHAGHAGGKGVAGDTPGECS